MTQYRLHALVLLLLVWVLGLPLPALAQSPQPTESFVVYGLQQQDLDGDGSPDLTVMDTSFHTERDQVLVYDGAGDMVASDDWRQATDFDDDTWVFDVGADGTANLIAVFDTDGREHIAYFYDDQDGNAQVEYEVTYSQVVIHESPFWTVKVVADGSWYNADGSINRNVTISVDGALGERGLDFDFILKLQVNDGQTDLEMECCTGAWQDMSAYCLTRLFVPFPWSIGRTKLRVAVPGYPLPEIKGFVFWPHLGPGLYKPQEPREIMPALRMDWADARFNRKKGINNLVQWVGPEAGWWLFSSRATVKQQDNVLDFENPFAHYDLAADRDGWAELVIRHVYSPPGSVWYKIGDIYKPSRDPRHRSQIVRYTWDQDNDGYWEYKLGLIGRNLVDTVVAFPDFGLVSIPYKRLPRTLTEMMQWDGATFVQVEGQRESSPEGVYEWDEIYPLSRSFIFGIGDTLEPGMNDVRTNFRGEYRVAQFETPRLYFSPVDHKLHLFGAEAGVWNLNGVQRVRYADLDGDGYLDQWTFTVQSQEMEAAEEGQTSERVVKSLQVVDGFWVYGDAERVRIVRSAIAPGLFETLPPRNHGEWLALGEQLDRYRQDFAPDNFLGMMAQFQGPSTDIEGASLEDFRLTDNGFRFVLSLLPGFRAVSDENAVGAADLVAGSYMITYDGTFRAQSLTAPHITVPSGEISCDPSVPQQMGWVTTQVVLHNDGLRDVRSLPLRLYAAREGCKPLLLAEEQVSVPGEGVHTLIHKWPPREAGRWTIWVEADAANTLPAGVELGPMARLEVEVEPAAMPDIFRPAGRYDGVRLTWPVALLLVSAGLAALSVLGMILIRSAEAAVIEPTSDE